MRRALLGHGVAFTLVMSTMTVSVYALHGAPIFGLLLSVFASAASGVAAQAAAKFQDWRGKPNLAGPLIWSAALAWAASVWLLVNYPRQLRFGTVLSSVFFAGVLVAPFASYWTIYYCLSRRASRRTGGRVREVERCKRVRRVIECLAQKVA